MMNSVLLSGKVAWEPNGSHPRTFELYSEWDEAHELGGNFTVHVPPEVPMPELFRDEEVSVVGELRSSKVTVEKDGWPAILSVVSLRAAYIRK